MCNNFPNIRITEGNNFSLVLPLRSRTYVATRPIDEDIDPAQLENVVVTFGGVEYPAQIIAQGVQIDLPATLAVGTYNILLTADYLESSIRAAYESAVTIVQWSAQSTAEQYITGSPIVLRAAYVLSGALTDAELEALKQEYREKNAQLDEAIAEYERRAAELDGVAQQGSDPTATNTAILQAIQQSGGEDVAKESTSQEILFDLQQILSANILRTNADGWIFNTQHEPENGILANLIQHAYYAEEIHDVGATDFGGSLAIMIFAGMPNLTRAVFDNVDIVRGNPQHNNYTYSSSQPYGQLILDFPNASQFIGEHRAFQNIQGLGELHMPNVTIFTESGYCFSSAGYLRDISVGEIETSFSLRTWSPANVSPSVYLPNIKNHIADRIADLTGRTAQIITFSAAVKAAILADQQTADAFTNKNWIIA